MVLVILGLGNDLLGDDGIGLVAADALHGLEGPDISVRSTAQAGLYLVEHLQGFDDAIVIDSVIGDVPGTIRELQGSDIRAVPVPSAHYAGLPEALALAKAAGLRVPLRLRIFGVEIAPAQRIGSAPSSGVTAALPRLVDTVLEAAHAWGYALGAPRIVEAVPHA